MAAPPISTSTVGDLLKRLYAGWEIEQLVNVMAPTLAECAPKGNAPLGGSGFFFPVRTESSEGHGFISETGTLPSGRESTVLQAQVTPAVQAGVVELSGLSMAVSSSNAMAFARVFDENVRQIIQAMTAYKEGAMFRDGTGILTRFNGDPGDTVGPHVVDDANHLREGMYVDVIKDDAAFTRHHLGIKVTHADWVNKQVTLGTALSGVGDNARLYIAGTQAQTGTAAPVSLEPIGLEGSVLASGTYLGIDRATHVNWRANAITASAFLDEGILLQARTRITQESGIDLGGISSRMKLLAHPMQADQLFKLAIPRIRFSGNEAFDLGNSRTVSFGGVDVVTSYLCPAGTAYLGDFSYHNTLYTPNGELHVDTEYNGSALKWVANTDTGRVFLKSYCAFALRRPNAFCRIASLTELTR